MNIEQDELFNHLVCLQSVLPPFPNVQCYVIPLLLSYFMLFSFALSSQFFLFNNNFIIPALLGSHCNHLLLWSNVPFFLLLFQTSVNILSPAFPSQVPSCSSFQKRKTCNIMKPASSLLILISHWTTFCNIVFAKSGR